MSTLFKKKKFFIAATDDSPGLKKLDQMMLECAKLDREINCFVESVEQMVAQVGIFAPCDITVLLSSFLTELPLIVGETRASRCHVQTERLSKGAIC